MSTMVCDLLVEPLFAFRFLCLQSRDLGIFIVPCFLFGGFLVALLLLSCETRFCF